MKVRIQSFFHSDKGTVDQTVQQFVETLSDTMKCTVTFYFANGLHYASVTWYENNQDNELDKKLTDALTTLDEVKDILSKQPAVGSPFMVPAGVRHPQHPQTGGIGNPQPTAPPAGKFIDLDEPVGPMGTQGPGCLGAQGPSDEMVGAPNLAPSSGETEPPSIAPEPPALPRPEFTSNKKPSIAIMVYHSNIEPKYHPMWIEDFRATVQSMAMAYKQFGGRVCIFELNYGQETFTIFNYDDELKPAGIEYKYLMKEFPHHVAAQNYWFDVAEKHGYDLIANTNADDFYKPERLVRQVVEMKSRRWDICSSNYMLVDEQGNNISLVELHFEDINKSIATGTNVVSHPCVTMWASTWRDIRPYDELTFEADRLAGRPPHEDLDLWKRAIEMNKTIGICDDYFTYYRAHPGQVGRVNK